MGGQVGKRKKVVVVIGSGWQWQWSWGEIVDFTLFHGCCMGVLAVLFHSFCLMMLSVVLLCWSVG